MKMMMRCVTLSFLVGVTSCIALQAQAQTEAASYPAMAPINEYLTSDENSEIAFARSAAPASISGDAEVMILGRNGYTTALKGSNGFLCMVQRSWAAVTDAPEFWNPKIRAPICLNPPAVRTYLPFILLKTKLVVAGKTKAEIAQAVKLGMESKELPPLERDAMSYMMSKQQYLSDRGMNWHPHVMFFVQGNATKSWGANLPDSPVMAADDPEERMTIFFVWVGAWSDGTPVQPMMMH